MLSKHAVTSTRVEISEDLREVIQMFQSRAWPDDGWDFDPLAFQELLARGFTGQLHEGQTYTGVHGKPYDGWMNICVQRGGAPIAIEIDRRTPREKSVRKLRLFKGERLIVIRRGKSFRPMQLHGIHRVISVGVVVPAKSSPATEQRVANVNRVPAD